jgi:hypothetical protein
MHSGPAAERACSFGRVARQDLGGPLTVLLALLALILTLGCSSHVADYQSRQQASSTGKYKVELTTDAERVAGTCKYVHTIQPDLIPLNKPTDAQLPDYYRQEAAYYGADTVLVRGRIGEAYVCGPAPLNPDGSRRTLPPNPTPSPQ